MVESIVAHNSAESASDSYDKSGQITSADYASLSDDYDNTGNRDLTYAICKARWNRVLQDEQDEFILCILSLMFFMRCS